MEDSKSCVQDDCLHQDDPDAGDKIRCLLCSVLHHIDCVSVQRKEMKNAWTCFKCRLIASSVSKMQETLTEMQKTQATLLSLLQEMTDKIKLETDQRMKVESELVKVTKELNDVNTKMKQLSEPQASENQNAENQQSAVPAPPKPSLLLGTSLLRNVDPSRLENYEVIAKGGATLSDLNVALSAIDENKSYEEIVIVGGSIDLENKTPKAIAEDCQALSVSASLRTNKTKICSIPPRTDKDLTNANHEANSEIRDMTDREGIDFIDLNGAFTLHNGQVNKPLLHNDGLHLSNHGVDSLLQACNVKLKNDQDSAFNEIRYQQNRPLHFQGHTHPLSNFYPVNGLYVDGIPFATSEAAYVYKKALYHNDRRTASIVRNSKTGIHAKRLGDKIRTQDSWATAKIDIMDDIVRTKLSVCEDARKVLLSSSDREIVEDTPNKFWGRGTSNDGQNTLGKLWMMYRSKLRNNTLTRPRNRQWATRQNQPKCFRCGEPGHLLENCRKPSNVNCWNCGRLGHKQKHCRDFQSRGLRR